MGWTVTTYKGTYMLGQPSKWRIVMFELCRAINEREAAIPTTKTKWLKVDGTEASDVTMDDLLGMRLVGTDNPYCQNLDRIRLAVLRLVSLGVFTISNEDHTILTYYPYIHDIYLAAGGGSWERPVTVINEGWFQGIQNVLDILLYTTTPGGLSASLDPNNPTSYDISSQNVDSSGVPASSKDEMWNLVHIRGVDTIISIQLPSSLSWSQQRNIANDSVVFGDFIPGDITYGAGFKLDNLRNIYISSGFGLGNIVGGLMSVPRISMYIGSFPVNLNPSPDLLVPTISLTLNGISVDAGESVVLSSGFFTSSLVNMNITGTPPASPFNPSAVPYQDYFGNYVNINITMLGGVGMPAISVYRDLTSILTDQAP